MASKGSSTKKRISQARPGEPFLVEEDVEGGIFDRESAELVRNVTDAVLTKRFDEISLLDHACLFLDCQTTGASPDTGNLLEIAWCTGNASGIISPNLNSFLAQQPEDEAIPFRIQTLTGITDDEMVYAIPQVELLQHLLASTETLPAPRLCIIHYARFETPFLNTMMEECRGEEAWPFHTICTFEIARRLYPNLPSRGIRALGGFLGIDMEDVKRAHSHVQATVVIWNHLVEQLANTGITTLSQLEEFLSTKATVKRNKLEYPLERLKRLELPSNPGVYRMLNQSGRVLYVGKATSLKSRVNSHFTGRKRKTSRSFELLTQVSEIQYTICGSPLEAALLETDEIKRLDPPYNSSLKQGQRVLLYGSRDLCSFNDVQDSMHPIGPIANTRTFDSLLRLSSTINSGVIDPLILFNMVPVEELMVGIDIFLQRHDIDFEAGVTPRSLLAHGLSMFRTTKRELRELARQRALAALKAEQSEVSEENQDDASEVDQSDTSAIDQDEVSKNQKLEELAEEDFDEDSLFDSDTELTPEEVADRLDSILISIARSYLVTKELTSLLNSQVQFEYKRKRHDLFIKDSKIFLDAKCTRTLGDIRSDVSGETRWNCEAPGIAGSLAGINAFKARPESDQAVPCGGPWDGLDIRDYDRMRVLLTEIAKMQSKNSKIAVSPPIRFLSKW